MASPRRSDVYAFSRRFHRKVWRQRHRKCLDESSDTSGRRRCRTGQNVYTLQGKGGVMEIRNAMEDAVKVMVEELFEREDREKSLGYCTCDQCKLDVACYVLNRVKPEYIVSSRGLAYSEKQGLDKVQRQADLISLVKEGWGKVSHFPRPTSDHVVGKPINAGREGPVFNFPTIMGRVFDG